MDDKEGSVSEHISKGKKLNGRSYKEWVKSLVKTKKSDSPIQAESALPQIEANVTGQRDSIDNETADTDSSTSSSIHESMCFRLKRIKYSSHVERSSSPECTTQNVEIENCILVSQGNVNESKSQENASGEECKSSTTVFVEYWVPVKLSRLQMELYCSSLFSNSVVLYSPDNYNAKGLREILVSTRKCCDHPYLVDRSLRASLMEGVPQSEQLGAEIKLSGKLSLLHKTLLEIRKRGLRVLVIYQEVCTIASHQKNESLGGSNPVTIGDILDDIIHEVFGRDSFTFIDRRMLRSVRRAVLDSFNDQKGGKLVCLMDIHSCTPSIKLKSIDAVILFNSSCDPMNDLKALQRINLDSQFEQVKIFRLYSAHSVEEKALMLAKQETTREGNLRNIKASNYHDLLTWSACYLFQKLDDLQNVNTEDKDSIVSHENSLVEDVLQELCILLPNNDKSNVQTQNSLVLEVQQTGGVYFSNLSLVGEAECSPMDNFSEFEMLIKKPHVFWMNILEGRKPRWKYAFCRSVVQTYDDLLETWAEDSSKKSNTVCQFPANTRRTRSRRRSLRNIPAFSIHKGKEVAVRISETPTHTEVLQSACKALQAEMERLQKQKFAFSKQRENTKQQTIKQRDREIDDIKKKYDVILQKAEMAFVEEEEAVESRINKVRVNKELAESLMQKVPQNTALSQVTTRFVVEQTHKLISQKPPAIERDQVAEQTVQASPNLHISDGCLRATAPHFRQQVGHSSPSAVLNRPSETISLPLSLESLP